MKKLAALCLTLSLLMLCLPAMAADYTADGVGTFTLPDGMEVDNTSYTDENTEESIWLFDAFDGNVTIECYNDYLSGYEGVSLFTYTDDELSAYIEDALADFSTAEYPASYVETVRAGQIPFVVYVLEDEEGRYYYAETIANGWCISLALYNEENPLPEDQLPALRAVLASFSPAV